MTTIVAVEAQDRVIIGCDSQITAGHSKSTMETSKVLPKGEYTLAVAGRARMLQALRHADLPALEVDDVDYHMSEVFAPALANIGESAGLDPHESVVLAVLKRRVYVIHGDGTYIRNSDGVYSIGSGSAYALGALTGLKGRPTVQDVERALHAAATHDIGTAAPFKISMVF